MRRPSAVEHGHLGGGDILIERLATSRGAGSAARARVSVTVLPFLAVAVLDPARRPVGRRNPRRSSRRAASRVSLSARPHLRHPTIRPDPPSKGAGMPQPMLKPVRDQVVVVMGASGGIGRATAARFASKGARVVVAARGEAGLRSLVDQMRADGGTAVAEVADVTDPA